MVEVHFRGGVSVREAYLQKQPFTEAQGLQLLLNNTNLSPWITANFGKSYTREDGTAEAGGVGDRIFWIQLIRPRNNILNGLQGF